MRLAASEHIAWFVCILNSVLYFLLWSAFLPWSVYSPLVVFYLCVLSLSWTFGLGPNSPNYYNRLCHLMFGHNLITEASDHWLNRNNDWNGKHAHQIWCQDGLIVQSIIQSLTWKWPEWNKLKHGKCECIYKVASIGRDLQMSLVICHLIQENTLSCGVNKRKQTWNTKDTFISILIVTFHIKRTKLFQ